MLAEWLDNAIKSFTALWPNLSFFNLDYNVLGLLALILVGLVCGSVSSLVLGNRLAFFSSALTHSAFAGVSLGFLLALASGVKTEADFYDWLTPVMVGFGILVGLGIAWVRERTSLTSDTVIGIFNAGALGSGAILLSIVSQRKYFNAENILFGNLLSLNSQDIINLFFLVLITGFVLYYLYNEMVFASFNPSLARSRGARVRLANYLFIALLAAIINLCLKTVGILLIHALLIVPAATAVNFCSNLRQFFWWTIILCVGVGLMSQFLSWQIFVLNPALGKELGIGIGGIMVVLSVLLFFLSMPLSIWLRSRRARNAKVS